MQKFKIVVPSESGDETEIDATLQGRDERTSLAFVRANSPQKWKSIKFVDESPSIGDPLYSVGLLPKGAGYKALVTTAFMSTRLRGPIPQMLVGGQLAGVGAASSLMHKPGPSATSMPAVSAKRLWIIRKLPTTSP